MMEEQQNRLRTFAPLVAGAAALVAVVGFLYIIMSDNQRKNVPGRKPDIAGLIDMWEVEGAKAYVEVAAGGKKLTTHQVTLDSSTTYIYRKGRRGDEDRPEEKGALANISNGLYVGIFLKEGTQVAETIVYADWPL